MTGSGRLFAGPMSRLARHAARRALDTGVHAALTGPQAAGLREATRLTRAGRLLEATEALRTAGGSAMPASFGVPRATGMPSWTPTATTPRPSGRPGERRGSAGGRSYRVVAPSQPQGGASGPGLLVMLHGGTQDADVFADATGMDELAEREGFVIVYPEQSRSANPMGYWNWFDPRHQGRGGEPGTVAEIVAAVAAEHGTDPARVAVAGFSAGAALAAVLGAAYPELVAGVGVHSGLPAGAAHDVGSAFAAMRGTGPTRPASPAAAGPPVIVVHGDADGTVAPVNGERVVAAAVEAGCARIEERGTTGGRPWTRERWTDRGGRVRAERWTVHGMGHAWSGGRSGGSYTDPSGPDASAAMVDFFGLRRDARSGSRPV